MHDVTLSPEVTEAIIAQRGQLYRFDRLEAAKSALVVIDLQNAFMLDGMPVEVPQAREIVPNVNRLAAGFRATGGTVVWVQMRLAGETDAWSVFFTGDPRPAALEELTPGAKGYELYSELDVDEQDCFVEKTRYSAFIQGSSSLDVLLKGRAIDTVVVVGTLTNVCCESTARDAMMLNYKVVLVSDANAAISDADHKATLATIWRVFGDIRSTDEVLQLLG